MLVLGETEGLLDKEILGEILGEIETLADGLLDKDKLGDAEGEAEGE
jgi:hypothetical protein